MSSDPSGDDHAGAVMNVLDVIGSLGPVRRKAVLTYVGTCPACLVPGALTVQITPTGELPRCRNCCVADVVPATVGRDRTHGAGR